MKNAFLIHGYNGIPKIYNWLKEELTLIGYKVIIPEFPPREGVIYDVWSEILDKNKKDFNSETIIIAHSIGNEFIIKYFVKNNINLRLYIGLAGFGEYFECEGRDDLNRATKEFLINDIEIDKFKKLVEKKYCIYSDNDHIVPFEALKRYPEKIDAKSILIRGIGHMGSKSVIDTMPEVMKIIKSQEVK